MVNKDISGDTIVKTLFERYPQIVQLFIDMGLLCVGCPTEGFHTLAEVANEYHLELDQLLKKIDAAIEEDEPRHP